MIDKQLILHELTQIYSKDLENAQKTATEAKELINQPDMKPEGKYDTRRTEAQYLAGAQATRAKELEVDLERIETLKLPTLHQKATIGSLVKCSVDSREVLIFISPSSGGFNLTIQGHKVQVTSYNSPIGDSLLGMEVDDFFELETPKGEIEYEILSII